MKCISISLPLAAESCNTAACGQYYYVTGAWGACSALCGDSGTASRNVTCMHQGQVVSPSSEEYTQNCLPLGEPVSIQQCFATPCEPYMWQLGPWGNCTGGQQNRTTSCQRVRGGSADGSVCLSTLIYLQSTVPFSQLASLLSLMFCDLTL